MVKYDFMILDSLQKVFPDQKPKPLKEEEKQFYAFTEESISFQLAYSMEYEDFEINRQEVSLCLESGLADLIQVRNVELVPSRLPAYHRQLDDNYLYTHPCLCPDLLLPRKNQILRPIPSQWRAVWFTVDMKKETGGESWPITVRIKKDGQILWEDSVCIHVLAQALPKQKLIHTEWFHADCLADYYKVPVFSEEHWRIIENFVETAVSHGVNMLLTPIFTPPLDTLEGGDRTTVQLVKVFKEDRQYRFDFSLLIRWLSMCRRKGITYIELSHLFTQWGAKHAPKIMVWENGAEHREFGWDTKAVGEAYNGFLRRFLPELKEVLKEEGVFEHTYFHISDEPHDDEKETYAAAKNSVKNLLEGCKIMDALSSYKIYQEGIIEHPIPCNDHIQPFIDAGVKKLWTYYCCVQGFQVSNRFMAMPPARNRILGVQLYLYEIEGFLHWGFNFYNAQFSLYPVNPYLITDADGGFPSGDPFAVYPAEDGTAYDSLRLEVFREALFDLRAFYKLEELTDRGYVTKLIQEGVEKKITFQEYPKDAAYIRSLRRKIYQEIQNNS